MQQYYLKGLMLGLISILLSSCGSYYFDYQYTIECTDCRQQKDSLIKIDITEVVGRETELEILVTNNSDKSIVFDRLLSTLTENDTILAQPIFIENPNVTIGTSVTLLSSQESTGLYYNKYNKNLYTKGVQSGASNTYSTNYTNTAQIVIPPKTSYKATIVDEISGKIYFYKGQFPMYYYGMKDQVKYINNKLSEFNGAKYKYYVYYKYFGENDWRTRYITTVLKNASIYYSERD